VKINSKIVTGIYTVALSLAFSAPVLAADPVATDSADKLTTTQDTDLDRATQLTQSDDEGMLEEVITTGTRSTKPRSAADSTVPVDVLSGDDFNAYGGSADLTDNLKNLVPSYTATPATGDGSAFVRPTSLRGTAPDQVLVLVNGKRRHRSALVQFFAPAAGNGAHGVDIGMIPGIAIKRVEVLRDGAASQYGSDAIAGVINFITKDDAEGGSFVLQYGQHYEGEASGKFAANAGFALGDNGFINLSLEYIDNEALSRGIQRTSDVARLLAAGVDPAEIGADAPFGDSPLLQTWGRPETKGTRFFMNSGWDLSDTSRLYLRVGYADTDGRYRFFYRNENHSSTLAPLRDLGFTGLPAGFTPFLDGSQKDTSIVAGFEGEFNSGMLYDFSVGYGKNDLDYFLNNTVNADLGLDANLQIPQMDFDVGGYTQDELNINADFSYLITDAVNLAFGAEWREETYTVVAGEPGASLGGGSSGFKGITERDAGEFSRDNFALYADVEHDVTDRLLLQYALRYEDFSDFGETMNYKLAGRFRVNDGFAFRGAASTGFHAPTPGQANVRTTITTFDGVTGEQVEEGLIPSTDPRIAAVGGAALTEETSANFSLGFTADIFDSMTLTMDIYTIKVSDRIYRTGDIPFTDPLGRISSISFYTNALDVKHEGVDIVFNANSDWSGNSNTVWTAAYAYNKINVTGQKQINGVNPVNDGLVEDIENNYPNHRFVLTGNTFFGERWNLLARLNYYGSHYDERGRIGAADSPSAEIGDTIYFDAEIGFQMTDQFRLAAGAVNIFDSYIDEVGPPNANRLSVGLQYPRRSAANYEGGAWYLKGTYSW